MSKETVTIHPISAGLSEASEYAVPGGSNLLKGDLTQAVAHAGLGLFARAAFGPIGLLVVSANSLSVALTNRGLGEHLNDAVGVTLTAPAPAPRPAR